MVSLWDSQWKWMVRLVASLKILWNSGDQPNHIYTDTTLYQCSSHTPSFWNSSPNVTFKIHFTLSRVTIVLAIVSVTIDC